MRNQPADENEISNDLPEKDAESQSFSDGKFQVRILIGNNVKMIDRVIQCLGVPVKLY